MIEVYKYLNGLSPDIMNDIFKLRENTYNLRNFHIFESQNPRTKKFGLDSIAYRASQLWKNVPELIGKSFSLPVFKVKIKKIPTSHVHVTVAENTFTTWVFFSYFICLIK